MRQRRAIVAITAVGGHTHPLGHARDAVAVPDRLEDGVREAEDEDVLDRLFTQVVIDPVDLRLVEPAVDELIEEALRD
jgi:hypothetical protein